MTVFAGKAVLPFEPKMAVNMAAIAATATPANLQPNLGPLAALTYKPTRMRYLIRLSAAPTVGAATLNLKAGETVIRAEAVSLVGVTTISNSVAVDLSSVAGETPLSVELDVTAAADAGITATLDAVLDVEQPVTLTGC